jgi:DNA-binding PadR family transcriptional regulator
MGKHSLGEFEEILLLTIIILQDNAYGVTIQQDIEDRLKRKVSLGAMRTALDRMESKGMVQSAFGEATAVRGGKRKKFFTVTNKGREALETVKEARENLWDAVRKVSYNTHLL